MSATDPANDGTFEVLDHLPKPVRQRYVEKLGKEELAAIVLAIWSERDEAGIVDRTGPDENGKEEPLLKSIATATDC